MIASKVRWTMSLVWSWVSPISSEICLTISFLVTVETPRGDKRHHLAGRQNHNAGLE